MPELFDCYDLFQLSLVMQGDGDQERLKRQQELTALNLYQLQQLQYQYLLRYTRLQITLVSVCSCSAVVCVIREKCLNLVIYNMPYFLDSVKKSVKALTSSLHHTKTCTPIIHM